MKHFGKYLKISNNQFLSRFKCRINGIVWLLRQWQHKRASIAIVSNMLLDRIICSLPSLQSPIAIVAYDHVLHVCESESGLGQVFRSHLKYKLRFEQFQNNFKTWTRIGKHFIRGQAIVETRISSRIIGQNIQRVHYHIIRVSRRWWGARRGAIWVCTTLNRALWLVNWRVVVGFKRRDKLGQVLGLIVPIYVICHFLSFFESSLLTHS